jgi:hypothetical protein
MTGHGGAQLEQRDITALGPAIRNPATGNYPGRAAPSRLAKNAFYPQRALRADWADWAGSGYASAPDDMRAGQHAILAEQHARADGVPRVVAHPHLPRVIQMRARRHLPKLFEFVHVWFRYQGLSRVAFQPYSPES